MKVDYDNLEKTIGYFFSRRDYLLIALTHSSYANEMKINKCDDYERQEFLGDAVLELVSSDFLYKKYTDYSEGRLTKIRSSLVCEPALAFCAKQIGLEQYIRLGKGEEATGGRMRDSIISDVFEALIGAIYLDGGFEPARDFIINYVMDGCEDRILFYDSKSLLQEKVQASKKKLEYKLISETGPDHQKEFVIEAIINGVSVGTGSGNTKKAAEQQAAVNVLRSNKCI